ncbi:hypothetical protein PL373_16150 [Tenacibaculum maritimum]|nr:hypothetical protein [Tenacibaculum maritimum]MDB0602634.1 hypothetical protein [Tenacibaculum maritimum]MDB0611255.1 hypothetical protein [Tenacibaculum maritimum]
MKLSNLNINTILIAVLIFLLAGNMFYPKERKESAKISIVRDTIWQTKIDTFKVQTIKYKKVFVHKKAVDKIIKDTVFIKDTSNYIAAKLYRDTLKNSDLEIYSYNLVKGTLLNSQLSYKLRIPKEIKVTKTIEHPKVFRSGLYLFSEVGGNSQKFDNLSFGLQYNFKGKWFASYRTNFNQYNQPTHNVGFGFRLFN